MRVRQPETVRELTLEKQLRGQRVAIDSGCTLAWRIPKSQVPRSRDEKHQQEDKEALQREPRNTDSRALACSHTARVDFAARRQPNCRARARPRLARTRRHSSCARRTRT